MTDTASASLPALGSCLEDYPYPYPVRFLRLTNDLRPVAMAYMDIPPTAEPNGQTVVLFHGKAFGCYYFQNVIEAINWTDPEVIRGYVKGYFARPDPKVWVVPDCGHIPHLEQPSLFLAELLPFLAS